MYLTIPSQPDCCRAWLAAVQGVRAETGNEAINVILDVSEPVVSEGSSAAIIPLVEHFLSEAGVKPLTTVANTIFPSGIYQRHGRAGLYDAFHNRLLPKVRKSCNWTGYYFERMTAHVCADGESINPLDDIIRRLGDSAVKARHKFELTMFDPTLDISTFDPGRDLNDSPYGGQCLSHLSFKVVGKNKRLSLTAYYRNHYYIEKLLGNLIGLTELLRYVAKEAGLQAGSLTILSGHAVIDTPRDKKMRDVDQLISNASEAIKLDNAEA